MLAIRQAVKPNVIQLRCQDVLPSALGELLLRAIQVARPYLEQGALLTVDPLRERIRLLPL